MLLKEVHKDIERYLEQECYCPHEVYSVDGFFYELVFGDAEAKIAGTYEDRQEEGGKITLVITAGGSKMDKPLLMNIWHTDERVTGLERYEYSDENLKNISGFLEGTVPAGFRLTEAADMEASLSELFGHADAVLCN